MNVCFLLCTDVRSVFKQGTKCARTTHCEIAKRGNRFPKCRIPSYMDSYWKDWISPAVMYEVTSKQKWIRVTNLNCVAKPAWGNQLRIFRSWIPIKITGLSLQWFMKSLSNQTTINWCDKLERIAEPAGEIIRPHEKCPFMWNSPKFSKHSVKYDHNFLNL